MEKLVRRWMFVFALLFSMLANASLPIFAQSPQSHVFDGRLLNPVDQGKPYRAYAELTGRANDVSRVHTDLFVPLLSNRECLLFADVRGQWLYGGGAEGNLGLAYRNMVDDEFIIGLYSFYDLTRSENSNTFHQATFGCELLSDKWDLRFNGYLPEGGSAQAIGATALVSSGNLVVQNNQEQAYYGFDVEIGRLLWRMPKHFDSEVRVFAGAYSFDASATGTESISGPRLRAELRSFDLPFLALDSRLTAGVQYQHDEFRDSQTSATLSVRMPFGADRNRHRPLTRLERRMTDRIVRAVDVVTEAAPTPGGQETALHAEYDFEIGSVTVLNADTVDLPAAVANATTDSVIIDGARGEIDVAVPIEVQPGQTLIGGGIIVKGADTGVTAVYGSQPTLRGTDRSQPVILVADYTIVSGLNIVGGLHGIASNPLVDSGDIIGVWFLGNTVTEAADSGFRFNQILGNSIVAHNRSNRNGLHGFEVAGNAGFFSLNDALYNRENGFNFIDNFGDVSFNRAQLNEGHGFFVNDNGGQFSENEANRNKLSGFIFLDNNQIVSENVSDSNEEQGFIFASNNGLVLENVASENESIGFEFSDNNYFVADNVAYENDDIGFFLEDNGPMATFTRNIAQVNDGTGFDFYTNYGVFEENVSQENNGDGFDFLENAVGGRFDGNYAENNQGLGYDGINNGAASRNTGAGNEGGNDVFP